MGLCKYCGKNAGFLRYSHPECEQKNLAITAVNAMKENIRRDLLKIGTDPEEVERLLKSDETPDDDKQESRDIITTKKPVADTLSPVHTTRQTSGKIGDFSIHDDIKFLLWFGDGELKNITEEQTKDNVYTFSGVSITIIYGTDKEPSLIFSQLLGKEPENESVIPRPPYYPTYSGLSFEQRWIYWKLLSNPYNSSIDIGYVFILYYGLERHLLYGNFDQAFKVILKLRDVHKNNSFQSYSGNALILSALLKGKGEYIPLFINSLDKEHEFNFSHNLFIMCYYSFDLPLTPKDMMRMAKTFFIKNVNYIKNSPDVFEKCLAEVLVEKTGRDSISIRNYITATELEKIKYAEIPMYANMSLLSKKIRIPILVENMELKKIIFLALTLAHDKTKFKLAEMRKQKKGE